VLAAVPANRHMVVVDRPGFAMSQPETCVPDIRLQAEALAPLLQTEPGQRLLLVGQSYGAAIATLMAAGQPRRVHGLVLLSSYLGESGPTARWLVGLGERVSGVIPRDLRHAVIEVSGQPAQLGHMRRALKQLRAPIHVIHGDKDDFAPIEAARRLVAEAGRPGMRFQLAPGAGHFLTHDSPDLLLAMIEDCIRAQAPRPRFAWPKLAWPWKPAPKLANTVRA
jgi:pimeloyl-ACP methyl ester carboxylesterase